MISQAQVVTIFVNNFLCVNHGDFQAVDQDTDSMKDPCC